MAHDLSTSKGLVVATGGGVVLDADNMRDFYASGLVVCLQCAPDVILQRVEGDTNRPLLAGSREEKLVRMTSLMKRRRPLYDAIPNQIDTSNLSIKDVATRIEALYTRI